MRKKDIENQEHRYLNRSLWANLQSLKSTVSFMQTGAHPDDETSRLLAKLSLGEGYYVSYINAVRGQGGQNSIGPERDDNLGALRTYELLKAMSVLRVDIGWLANSRNNSIIDFGLSKSAEETFEFWDKNYTIQRMIRMVRAYKPDIIIPTFLDIDGQHGHHRAVTRATIEAFDKSYDPEIFPDDNFGPWKISQMFLPAWSGGGGSYDDEEDPPEATHFIHVGNFNHIFGGTFNQIGEWSRSYHATQNIGKLAYEDKMDVPLHLLKGKYVDGDITGGLIPKNFLELSDIAINANGKKILKECHKLANDAIQNFNKPEHLVSSLCKLKNLLDTKEPLVPENHSHRIILKQKQCSSAMVDCIALLPDLNFTHDIHYTGGNIEANLSIHKNENFKITDIKHEIIAPFNTDLKFSNENKLASNRINYFYKGLINQKESYQDLYQEWHGIALEPNCVHAKLNFNVNDTSFSTNVMPKNNFAIIPDIIGSLENDKIINVIKGGKKSNDLTKLPIKFLIKKYSPGPAKLILNIPDNWVCSNTSFKLEDNHNFETTPFNSEIHIPSQISEGVEKLYITSENDKILGTSVFGYSHTGEISLEDKCELSILNLISQDLKGIKIGWIDGYADKAWKWARMLGADVHLLSDEEIISEDFSKFDTIVSGVFAGASRPIHKVFNKINKWIENGGNYVTEYQRPQDNWNEKLSGPYFLKIGSPSIRWRVTNPSAEVGFLDPNHPILNFPNKISSKDFNNWIKERGLYFASSWDEKYKPLFMMSDDNEQPLLGGLLAADYGSGRHIHCALNLFYQMDNLVPGAFRIFVNILKK